MRILKKKIDKRIKENNDGEKVTVENENENKIEENKIEEIKIIIKEKKEKVEKKKDTSQCNCCRTKNQPTTQETSQATTQTTTKPTNQPTQTGSCCAPPETDSNDSTLAGNLCCDSCLMNGQCFGCDCGCMIKNFFQ